MNPNRPSPSGRPSPNRNGPRPAPSTWKRRLVFSPEGHVQEEFREIRPGRPGRQERNAIRDGQRPFFQRGGPQNPPSGQQPGAPGQRYPSRPDNFRPPDSRPPFPRPPIDGGGYADRPAGAASYYNQAPPRPWGTRPDRGPGELRRDGPGRPEFRGPPRFSSPGQDRFQGGDRFRRPEGTTGPGGPWRDGPDRHGFEERPGRGQLMAPSTFGGPIRPPVRSFRKAEPPAKPISIPQLAAEVIQKSNRDVPADAALRSVLKNARGLSPVEAEAISRAVFQHYRWFGWLDTDGPIEARLEHSAELAARFERDPASFSDADLRAHTVPEWTWLHVEAPADWARSLQTSPRLWLRVHPAYVEELPQELEVRPGPFAGSFLYQGSEDLYVHPAFQAGEFEIQDLASQAVSLICAPQGTETWWDACAGEGGKTLHLSALMGGKGMIWASDRAAWRLERLRRRTARAHCFNYRVAPWDGGEKPPTKTEFDGILVDAPCSGAGTWGRNPHARWTTTPTDIQELAEAQRRLLTNARGSLKPGGRLIYAVCTVTRAETVEISDWFTHTFASEFEPLPFTNPFSPQAPSGSPLTLWPNDTGGNGMFIAAWKRKAAV